MNLTRALCLILHHTLCTMSLLGHATVVNSSCLSVEGYYVLIKPQCKHIRWRTRLRTLRDVVVSLTIVKTDVYNRQHVQSDAAALQDIHSWATQVDPLGQCEGAGGGCVLLSCLRTLQQHTWLLWGGSLWQFKCRTISVSTRRPRCHLKPTLSGWKCCSGPALFYYFREPTAHTKFTFKNIITYMSM